MSNYNNTSNHSRGNSGNDPVIPNDNQKGAIPELKGNIFTMGDKNSFSKYNKVKQRIGEYCGRTLGKDMHSLILKGTDNPPKEPAEPTPLKPETRSEADKEPETKYSPFAMRRYDMDYNAYKKELYTYKCNKGKVFIIILGQCNTRLMNKLEGLGPKYETINENQDVVGLLDLILQLVTSTSNKEYEYMTLVRILSQLITLGQYPHESLADYERRFVSTFDMLNSHWGDLLPSKLPQNDDKPTAIEKLKAYLFLKGACKKRFDELKQQLHSNHITNAGKYPATFSDMVALMNDALQEKHKPNLKRDNTPHPRREDTSHAQHNDSDSSQDSDSSDDDSSRRSVKAKKKKTKKGKSKKKKQAPAGPTSAFQW